ALGHQVLELRPGDRPPVEPEADPPLVPHVGRNEEPLRRRVDQRRLRSRWRLEPQRRPPALVVPLLHGEDPVDRPTPPSRAPPAAPDRPAAAASADPP